MTYPTSKFVEAATDDVPSTEQPSLVWYDTTIKNNNEFLTFEDVDKIMKSYDPTEFRKQYLNEPKQ
jgi:hypothetical protein